MAAPKIVSWMIVIALLIGIGAAIYWYSERPEPGIGPGLSIEEPVATVDSWDDFEYVSPVDWPPQMHIVEGPFECTEAGSETERAGRTELRTIGDVEYCVTAISEGAAGSVYTQYAYASEADDGRIVILTWSRRAPQCANYDEPQRVECEMEQARFDPDEVFLEYTSEI